MSLRKLGCKICAFLQMVHGEREALSSRTGKAIDVEVISKESRECMTWRVKEGTVECQERWEGHQATCHGCS